MKNFFTSTVDTCKIGFQQHATLDMTKPIESQIHRRAVGFQENLDSDSVTHLKKIIEWNSSLRIGFGWSFESANDLQIILRDCQAAVKSPFHGNLVTLTTDLRNDWLGFVPFDVFDRVFYEDFCVEDLVYFNNALINYQTEIIKFITQHRRYQIHLMIRDEHYRFAYFKANRKDPVALSESFQYYMEAVADAIGVDAPVPRDVVEGMVGCHFLYHPDLFFELLQFYKLKGQIHE